MIELLVVIAIIALLSTIVITSLGSARAKGRDAKRVADIKSIQLALSLYYTDYGMYPKNIYCPTTGGTGGCSGGAPNNGLSGTYLPVMPTDPNESGTCTQNQASCYKYVALTAAASPACNTLNIASRYHLAAKLEDSSNSAIKQDTDAPVQTIATTGYQPCTGSGTGDFNGQTLDCTGSQLSLTQNDPAVTETCYDQMP